jgi:hypothetical protein
MLSSLKPANGKFVLGPPVETTPPVAVFTGPADHPDTVAQTASAAPKKKKKIAAKTDGAEKPAKTAKTDESGKTAKRAKTAKTKPAKAAKTDEAGKASKTAKPAAKPKVSTATQ